MEIWKGIITLSIPLYPRVMYTWGAILWAEDKLMVYEQEDVADAIAMRHGLIQKTLTTLNLEIEIDKLEN